jgi:hypothetical protein
MIVETSTLAPSAPLVPTQLSAAMACAYVLWLMQKTKALPWITRHTTGINAAVRAVLSAIATLGITIQWVPNAKQLIIGNLSMVGILYGLWHWFTQYAVAHGFEKLLYVIPGQEPVSGHAAAEGTPRRVAA